VPTVVALSGGTTHTVGVGDTIDFDDLPVDAVCTFDETGNGGADMGVYTLNSLVQLTPQMTVEAGTGDITLTNMYVLAHSGTDSLIWVIAAMVVAGTGIVLVGVSRRRRA
jgi:hypothetical protein